MSASISTPVFAVTRADATLPDDVDDHGPRVYAQARANLDALMADGTLVQDDTPCFYLYRQTWQGRTQVGLMAVCSVEELTEALGSAPQPVPAPPLPPGTRELREVVLAPAPGGDKIKDGVLPRLRSSGGPRLVGP